MSLPKAATDDLLLAWKHFPELIRKDQCFSTFRNEFEVAHGKELIVSIR